MDERTASLFELLPIGAYRSSIEGRQLRANAALVRLNGYDSEAELLAAVNDIGREWYVDPQRRAEFQRLMQRDGAVVDFVSEIYRHRTRERIWIRENAHLVRAADGSALYYEGTVEDISRTRRAEQALLASERRFRAYTEHSQQLTLVCDARGVIGYASPAVRRLLGLEPAQVLRSHVLDWVHPADRALAQADLGAVLDARPNEGLVVLATTPGGTAQSLGLRPQDVIVSANGVALTTPGRSSAGDSLAVAALRGQLERLRDGGRLALVVRRDGSERKLAGDVAPRYIPALRLELGEGTLVASTAPVAAVSRATQAAPAQSGDSCGRISVFHIAPRGQQLYPAKVLEIDGEIPGPARQDTFRVAPGQHTLLVAEQIDDNDLPSVYSRARRHNSKELVVEVAPGRTLLIASHLELASEREVPGNGYWTPVVWKEVSEPCN